jgi:hypothetical protein
MTKDEKIQFIYDLTSNICEDIVTEIKLDKIPEEWDGVELRWLVEEMAVSNFGRQDKKRKRAYNNTVIVNNL